MIALSKAVRYNGLEISKEGYTFMETTAAHPGGRARPNGSETLLKRILMALLILLALMTIATLLLKVFLVQPSNKRINGKEYQALFLTNGQVYFGKLSKLDSNYVELSDIYYLQTQAAQPAAGANAAQTQQTLSLAKLGSELHAPEDNMFVAKDQVLFWENLKDSGKVVQAIKSYQATKK